MHDVAASDDIVVLATDEGVLVADRTLSQVIPVGGPISPVGDTKLTVLDNGTILVAVWREGDSGVWILDSDSSGRPEWRRIYDNPLARNVAADPDDPSHLLVTLDDRPFHDSSYSSGVVETFDGGVMWEERSDGLPLERASVVVADPFLEDHWIVGTHGSGWWESFGVAVDGDPEEGRDGAENP